MSTDKFVFKMYVFLRLVLVLVMLVLFCLSMEQFNIFDTFCELSFVAGEFKESRCK